MKFKKILLFLTFIIGCSLTENCLQAQNLTATVNVANDCQDQCQGVAYIIAFGGVPPYTVNIGNGVLAPIDSITGLCQGAYSGQVYDSQNDSASISFVINGEFYPLQAYVTYNYYGNCNDVAYANASGGQYPYNYLWDGFFNGPELDNICAGQQDEVVVTDNLGCNVYIYTQDDYQPLTFSGGVYTNATCNSACNGAFTAIAAGGIGSYTYTWLTQPVQFGATATNLCVGTYQVLIVDSINDSVYGSVTINSTNTMQSWLNYDYTSSCLDTVNIITTGGTLPYSYKLNGTATKDTFEVSCASSPYDTITVTDSNGCSENINAHYIFSDSASTPVSVCYSFDNYIVPLDSQQQAFNYYGNGHAGFLHDWHVASGTPSIQPSQGKILPYGNSKQLVLMGVCDAGSDLSEGLELAYNFLH